MRSLRRGFKFSVPSFVALCLIVAILVTGVVYVVVQWPSSPWSQETQDRRAVERMVESQRAAQDVSEEDIPNAFAEAKQKNSDVCAWVFFPNTNISLPILQSLEYDRTYVNRSLDGSSDVLGATFIEKENSPFFIDPVTIVYGHAYEDYPDVMLGELHKFEKKDFFEANDTFYIYLEGKRLEYRIACEGPYVGDHILSVIKAGPEGSLQKYMTYAIDPQMESFRVRDLREIDATKDRIVQFSTCMFPSSGEYRYMVTGLLVNEEPI